MTSPPELRELPDLNRNLSRFLKTALFVAALATSGGTQSSPPGPWIVERFDQDEKLPPPEVRLMVENFWGDLRVRGSRTSSVRFHAVAQAPNRDHLPKLAVERSESVWAYRVVAGNESGAPPSGTRLDLAVELPEDRGAAWETGDGLLEIRGLQGFVRAKSRKGPIEVRGTGPTHLVSEHGSIRWAVHPQLAPGTSELETVSAAIEVELPAGVAASVIMTTQGHFTTDFSLQVQALGVLRKEARADLQGGGPLIRLTSQVGDLRLLARPAPQPTSPRSWFQALLRMDLGSLSLIDFSWPLESGF